MAETSKPLVHQTAASSPSAPSPPFTTPQLLQLLSRYEAEMQAKDVALAVLKAEKVRQLLQSVKAVQLGPSKEPELALLRDSVVAFERSDVGLSRDFFQSQLHQLDNFIFIQKMCNKKAKQALNVLEKRHFKILYEIDLAKEREKSTVIKSDDVLALLDNERLKIQAQLDKKDEEMKQLEEALEQADKLMNSEQERHQLVVLYLIHERKQLLLQINDLKRRLNSSSQTQSQDSSVVTELKKQVVALSGERDGLRRSVHNIAAEKEALQKKVVYLEEDLMFIRQNILLKTKQQTEGMVHKDTADGLIMANKVALAAEKQQFQPHMPSSASFPTGSRNESCSKQQQGSKPQIISNNRRQTLLKSGSSGFPPASNHSTVLLHRTPGRPSSATNHIPQLGIKATTSKVSNLPVNRNLATHLGTYRPTNRRLPTTEPGRIEIALMDSSTNNTASLTKRSSSLPRNTTHGTQFINHSGYRLPPNNNNNDFNTEGMAQTLPEQFVSTANLSNNNVRSITAIVPIANQRIDNKN